MDILSQIKTPIAREYEEFITLFNEAMSHPDGLLSTVLEYVRQKSGKKMRPLLILLVTKALGEVNDSTLNAALGLELLHTATLVHDDVVDESDERRGQPSVNALWDNKVSILVGDYILSTAMLKISQTRNHTIVDYLGILGRILSNGEILQLTNIDNQDISEEVYYQVIYQKTAALFEACAAIGGLSVGVGEEMVEKCKKFGRDLGNAFQIRDDIFDYYDDKNIGKPTGNDMAEGKLTLPVIYALNSTKNEEYLELALKVKKGEVTKEEIARLVEFTKQNGGMEYAEKRMNDFCEEACSFINDYVKKDDIRKALLQYVDFVTARNL